MKTICRQKFLQQLEQIKDKPENQKCTEAILILDEKTTAILEGVVTIDHILDQDVKYLTKCSVKKKPEPNCIGIYFISQKSIKSVAQDFASKPIYFSINILICEPIDEEIMEIVAQNENLTERLLTFSEFFFPVEYYSEKMAYFKHSDAYLKSAYQQIDYISEEIGEKVYEGICAGFNSLSSLELFYSDESKFCINMANRVKKMFESHSESLELIDDSPVVELPKIQKPKQETDSLKVIFFDRNVDFVSPAVRNFYYFPIIADLFGIEDFRNPKIENLNPDFPEMNLDYEDRVFQTYMNKHISEAFNKINNDLNDFTKENQVAKFQKEKAADNSNQNLKGVLKQLPQYSKTIKSYNQHIEIMKQISIRNKKLKLADLGELEHLIITSLTSQAEAQKDKKIHKKALEMLSGIKVSHDRARLIFLMLECLELTAKEKLELVFALEKTPGYEGFSMIFERPPTGKLRYNPLHKKESIFLDRHECIIAKRCQQILHNKPAKNMKKLDVLIEKGSTKLSSVRSLKSKNKQKVLVVMIGGLSVNEISNIERVAERIQATEVFFMTDHITTPKIFLDDLKGIFKQKQK